MAKQLATIKQFTGRMVTAGDVSDIRPEDSAYLENLVSDMGLLRLNRGVMEISSAGTVTKAHTTPYSFYPWNYPSGNMAFVYAYLDTSVKLGVDYGTTLSGMSSVTAKVIQSSATTIAASHNKSSYIPYRNILRVGTDRTYFPSSLVAFDAANSRFGTGDTTVRGLKLYCQSEDGLHLGPQPLEVYTAGVTDASPSRTTGAYSKHGIGITLVSQGTSNVGQFPEGARVYYGVTAVYDGMQESPMTLVSTPVTIGSGHTSVKIGIFCGSGTGELLIDDRITGFNIYRCAQDLASTSADDFVLVYQIDIKNGLSADDSGNTSLTWGVVATNYYGITSIDDPGFMKIERYSDRTGYTNYNLSEKTTWVVDNRVKWDIGAFVNGRAVVNSLVYYRNGASIDYEKNRLAISQIGKPDIFIPDSYVQLGINEGQGFKAMAAIGNARLVVWTANRTYVINCENAETANWFVEAEYHMGIVNGDAWTQYPGGLIFASNKGIYVVDVQGMITELGKTLAELTVPIRNLWDTAHTSTKLYYHYPTGLLYVIRFGTDPTSGLVINLRETGIAYWNASAGAIDEVAVGFLMFNGFADVPTIVYFNGSTTVSYHTVGATTGSMDVDMKTPVIDFGDSADEKTGKHVFMRYKSTTDVSYTIYINGLTATVASGTLSAASSGTTAKVRFPYRFRSIQIRLYTTSTTGGTFELNEISIEYKPRRAR